MVLSWPKIEKIFFLPCDLCICWSQIGQRGPKDCLWPRASTSALLLLTQDASCRILSKLDPSCLEILCNTRALPSGASKLGHWEQMVSPSKSWINSCIKWLAKCSLVGFRAEHTTHLCLHSRFMVSWNTKKVFPTCFHTYFTVISMSKCNLKNQNHHSMMKALTPGIIIYKNINPLFRPKFI